ncbi:MAG: DMT family transporter [Planctomycetota bacterium]
MSMAMRVVLAGVLFATGGALIKSCEMPSLQRAGVRALFAACTLFALLPEARQRPSRAVWLLIPAYFVATCFFVMANALTTAASTIFLQSTAPLWVLLLSPALLGERPRPRDLAMLVGIASGMALCFSAPNETQATAPNPALGNLLALLAGVGFAVLLVGMRRLAMRSPGDSAAVAAWGSVATCPLSFALMPLIGQTPSVGTASDWLVLLVLGVFQVGLAYAIFVRALPHVPAVQASLLLMIEPAINPLFALAAHGETPHWLTLAGGVLIVGSVAAGSVLRSPPRHS